MTTLSKSKILNHRQCPKRLWLEINQPQLAVINADMQSRFDVGNQVGALARARYPDGVMIDAPARAQQLVDTARALAGSPRPIRGRAFRNRLRRLRPPSSGPHGDRDEAHHRH